MSSKSMEPDRMNIEAQSQAYIELGRNEVAHRARQLWEVSGRPAGRDLEYWLQVAGGVATILVAPGSASEEELTECEAVARDPVFG